MIAKISRITLVLLAVLALSISLPALYRKAFEENAPYRNVSYSEILKDFIIETSVYDEETDEDITTYITRKGLELSQDEYDSLTPGISYRQLDYSGTMPDSVNGIQVNTGMFTVSRKVSYFGFPGKSRYGLDFIFESNVGKKGYKLPSDIMRVTNKGLEFIITDENKIDKIKSKTFTDALLNNGFTFPAKWISGISDTEKERDDGYFLLDNNDRLFQLKMVNAKPLCREVIIPNGIKIAGLFCTGSKSDFGYVFSTDNKIYHLRYPGFQFFKMPFEDFDKSGNRGIEVLKTLFYDSYTFYYKGFQKTYILDKYENVTDTFTFNEDTRAYLESDAGKYEQKLFPFVIEAGYRHSFKNYFSYSLKGVFMLNIILTCILLGIKIIKRRKIINPFNIIDLAMVIFFGIYGFIGVLIFPNRK